MSKEEIAEQIAGLENTIQLYNNTLIKERKIKEQLINKLEDIKKLVNRPIKKIPLHSARINFLAGTGSLETSGNKTEEEIIKLIREILN